MVLFQQHNGAAVPCEGSLRFDQDAVSPLPTDTMRQSMALTHTDIQAPLARSRSISNIAFIIAIILFVLFSMLAKWRLEPVAAVGADAADRFSAERAMNVLTGILADEKPHPVDSTENGKVRDRIVAALRASGYQPEIQQTTSCRKLEVYVCAKVKNITALHRGAPSGKTILLSAHYDSVGAGPGASDNGSGVSILLEVARMLRKHPDSKNSVLFLLTDGEEAGLLGAQAFASQSPLMRDLALAVNVEARGTSGQSALFETGSTSGWLVDAFAETSARPLANSLLSTVYGLLPNDTDLTIFKSRGVQGLNFAYGDQVAYYHTPHDNLKSLDRGSLQQQGDHVYGLVKSLLDKDIPAPESMGSLVYTDILGVGIVRWPTSAGLGIAIALLCVFMLCHWRIGKGLPSAKAGVSKGILIVALSALLGAVTGYLLTAILSLVGGNAPPWHSDDTANRLLLWSGALLVVLTMQRLLVRKSSPWSIWLGVGYAWLLASVASAIFLPGISYVFILPCMALAATSLSLLFAPKLREHLPLLSLLPASMAFVVMLGTVFMVETMLGFNELIGAVGMGMLIGLVASFFAPLFPSDSPSKILRYGAVAALLAVVGSAVFSTRAPAYESEQPQALNILYVQTSDGNAYLLSSNTQPPAAVANAMGDKASMKRVFPLSDDAHLAVPVVSAGLPQTRLSVLAIEQTKAGRKVTVRIDAGAPTRRVAMIFPDAMRIRTIEADGQVMDYSGDRSGYDGHKMLNCRGESCNGMQLTLSMDSNTPSAVRIETSLPLIEAAGTLVKARNTAAVPYQDGDRSIVMSSFSL